MKKRMRGMVREKEKEAYSEDNATTDIVYVRNGIRCGLLSRVSS